MYSLDSLVFFWYLSPMTWKYDIYTVITLQELWNFCYIFPDSSQHPTKVVVTRIVFNSIMNVHASCSLNTGIASSLRYASWEPPHYSPLIIALDNLSRQVVDNLSRQVIDVDISTWIIVAVLCFLTHTWDYQLTLFLTFPWFWSISFPCRLWDPPTVRSFSDKIYWLQVCMCCRNCTQRCCRCSGYVKPKSDTSRCTSTPRRLCCLNGQMGATCSSPPDCRHILRRTWSGLNWSRRSDESTVRLLDEIKCTIFLEWLHMLSYFQLLLLILI